MTEMSVEDLSREEIEEAVKELEEQLIEKEQELEEIEGLAKRTKADFENYKKKQPERKEEWKQKGQRELSKELIAVMDNLERAMDAASEDNALVQGVRMVADQLYETLEKKGLERIDAEGEEFDPRIHNAVATEEHEDDNIVLRQERPGYMHGDKVLRPAEVVVSTKNEE